MIRRTIIIFLFFFAVSAVFGQEEGQLVKKLDEKKMDRLITSVIKDKKFKNYDYNENSVVLWAEKLFEQYYNDKTLKVDFTEDDFKKLKENEKILFNTIERMKNDSALLANDKASLQTQLEEKNAELTEVQEKVTLLSESETKITALMETIERLKNDSASLADSKKTIQEKLDAKEAEVVNLNQTVNDLNRQLKVAESKYKAYEAAFDSIKNGINEGYTNKSLPLRRMDENKLQAAINKYQAAEDLLKTNKELYDEMQPEVEEMKNWMSLKQVLDAAVDYMTKKFDDKERMRLIAEIDKAFAGKTLTTDQVLEKDEIKKALENQKIIHANFLDVINAARKKKALSTDEVIQDVKGVLEMYEEVARLNGRLSDYHVSYFKAAKMMKDQLDKGENNPKLYDEKQLEVFLNELESMF